MPSQSGCPFDSFSLIPVPVMLNATLLLISLQTHLLENMHTSMPVVLVLVFVDMMQLPFIVMQPVSIVMPGVMVVNMIPPVSMTVINMIPPVSMMVSLMFPVMINVYTVLLGAFVTFITVPAVIFPPVIQRIEESFLMQKPQQHKR